MKTILHIGLILVFFSCSKDESTIENTELSSSVNTDWKSNPAFGYHKTKNINGFNIAVTYLPNSSAVSKTDIEENTYADDSLNAQDNSVHFIMEIESDGVQRNGNFLYKDVNQLSDFKDNVNYYNFSILEDVNVFVNNSEFNVVLSTMENTYTLEDKRKIHFVAVPSTPAYDVKNNPIQELRFVYDDVILGVGKVKFTFKATDFKPIPNKI